MGTRTENFISMMLGLLYKYLRYMTESGPLPDSETAIIPTCKLGSGVPKVVKISSLLRFTFKLVTFDEEEARGC